MICPVDGAPIGELLALGRRAHARVVDMGTEQPSLEQVFLPLTKRPDAAGFARRSP